jgi:NAD(P)-dependent dehydrogenase (short-subunit alcohol dehydrogenase family)
MLDLKDKLILVTGAARGIGRAVAIEYAKRGGRLIILDILGDQVQETAVEMKKLGYTGKQKLNSGEIVVHKVNSLCVSV